MIPCLVCGSPQFEVLLTPDQVREEQEWLLEFHRRRSKDLKDKADFTQSDPVFVLKCESCGTLVRKPQPTPEALRNRYRHDTYGVQTLQQLLENERGFFRAKARDLDLPSGSRVLEIGSFVGAFLLAAKERGWHAEGIDIGDETCTFMQNLGLNVHQGDVLQLQLSSPYDAICVWNTFDQINQPNELLDRLSELIKPGGTLALRVPNGAFKVACHELGEETRPYEAYNNFLTFPYLCGYTPESLTRLLALHGFEVKRVAGDVIVPLASKDTKDCAIEEEARAKRLVLRLCAKRYRETGEFLYPWIDVFSVKS